MSRLFNTLFLTVALTYTCGCGLLSKPTGAPRENKQGSTGGISQPVLEKKATGIEVTWEVPSEAVDGFVIRYGEDRAQLIKETTILISELREERDSYYGPVYRYIIRDVTDNTPLYVSIAAFKGDIISEFSDALLESKRALQ